jgi:hypothetical protein
MKIKLIILIISMFILPTNTFSQYIDVFGNNDDDIVGKNYTVNNLKSSTTKFSEHGGVFTAKRELKILIVFVTFSNNDSDPNNSSWPSNQDEPNWISDGSFIFDDLTDFNSISSENRSLSTYYYEMTKHLPQDERFKLYGNRLSVEIDPSGATWWSDLNTKVYNALETKYSNIESILHGYDSRDNSPNYEFDNSVTTADGIVDYVVIAYRYSGNWRGSDEPVANMHTWTGSQGGYSTINSKDFGTIEFRHGFTATNGISPSVALYKHEIGHELYEGPHYGGENNVVGNYFFNNSFWGMMPDGGNEIFSCANAWERWYMGWIDIKHDLDNSSQNGNYVLKDYMTTGEAIRIKMPYVSDQYIWIENHQGNNKFERRYSYDESLCGQEMPDPPKGVMIYAENINADKSSVYIIFSGANGIKHFNADGNYDFSIINTKQSWEWWCNNLLYNFNKGNENPYSGYSLSSRYFWDKDDDGTIDWWTDFNNGPDEQASIIFVDDEYVNGTLGMNSGFQTGDKLGISTNPAITNFQTYNSSTKELSPIFLNGISIEVVSKNSNGDVTLNIKFDDFDIENNIRMCGNIVLPPEALNLVNNKIIKINKSGVPNRHTKRNGEFINPSIVKTSDGTELTIEENSKIIVSDESALIVEDNSTIVLNDNAKIIVESGGTLHIKSGSQTNINGSGSIIVESGGNICIETGSNVLLQDVISVIALKDGYIEGVNTDVIDDPGNCSDLSTFNNTGNGSILEFSSFTNNSYVQNETITSDRLVTGKNIYVGYSVTTSKPYGNVTIKNGAKVIFLADEEVKFEGGFNVELGGYYDVK